ncbi:hypothetical protein N5C66_03685 [Rhizobium pusense]|uniref:Transmembrane protein n=1 Tax=Agrobacterium genomosp. 2 str. CFBP 5494 TaxID=1183436 RepID=A0A9W5AYF8_9HYPH|nr:MULTISPECIES: hypothetical protein [Rhizobium/Agrobacterium group]MDH0908419.1 hypothetical protein [Agrobacterium pusense]MDH1094251.1 hypothetical protein [Agrobacterium pusense]MDH1110833.1 hypothetical protein [Agrobacterium pusense]MDH2192163.1 hypothetical protein [Agrobacterium pusense]CAD7043577.1 hypothetical protein RP007_01042 [Rhizobium sp. P007]
MSDDNNSDYIFPLPPESPWQRIVRLLQRTLPSTLTTFALAFTVFTVGNYLVDRTTEAEKFWQLPNEEWEMTLTKLDATNKALSELAPMLQSNPDALKLLEASRLNVADSISVLRSLPYVERRAEIIPSFVSTAYAQAEATAERATKDATLRWIAFGLIGFVATVYVVTLVMYGLMKDKTKYPFMERTLNQIMGFLLGLITGVLSGQLG